MSFPLYDTLYKQIEHKNTPLSDSETLYFVEEFKNLDENTHEYIFALIRTFQKKSNSDNINELPYGIKSIKKGIKIDMEKLPSKLQQMLLLFLTTHLQSIDKL
jgi:hypothetical protein